MSPGSSWTGPSRFPRDRPAGISPEPRVGRHLGYGAARLLCSPSLPGSLDCVGAFFLGRPQPRRRGPARPPERSGLWPEPARRRGFCHCSLRCCCHCYCCPPAAGRWKVSDVGVPRTTGESCRMGPWAERTSKEALGWSRLRSPHWGHCWQLDSAPTAVQPWVFVGIAYTPSGEPRPSGFRTSGRQGNVGDQHLGGRQWDWALGLGEAELPGLGDDCTGWEPVGVNCERDCMHPALSGDGCGVGGCHCLWFLKCQQYMRCVSVVNLLRFTLPLLAGRSDDLGFH